VTGLSSPNESGEPQDEEAAAHPAAFPNTHWSLVVRMKGNDQAGRREALEELCKTYWYPAYAFVRRKGNSPQDAEDLTQGFFLRFIEKDRFAKADQLRGRFRTYLLTSLSHFLSDEYDRTRAEKRGGGRLPISIEGSLAEARYDREPRTDETPAALFDRRWALTILETGFLKLRDEYEKAGKAAVFEAIRPTLIQPEEGVSYREIGASLGITESHARVTAHRFRKHLRAVLREEIMKTVARLE
jgi:RNA polymerase sigma-70 factor (ECF subfamily)